MRRRHRLPQTYNWITRILIRRQVVRIRFGFWSNGLKWLSINPIGKQLHKFVMDLSSDLVLGPPKQIAP